MVDVITPCAIYEMAMLFKTLPALLPDGSGTMPSLHMLNYPLTFPKPKHTGKATLDCWVNKSKARSYDTILFNAPRRDIGIISGLQTMASMAPGKVWLVRRKDR